MIEAVLITLCLYFINSSLTWIQFNTFPSHFARVPFTQPHILKKSCLLKPDKGPCRAGIPKFYFDSESKNCSLFHWGGCQGNGNRYATLEECSNNCLSQRDWKPGRPRWCMLSFDYGYCFGGEVRYYYDKIYKVCKQTIYSGCGGNKNNFYNIEQCDEVCRFGNPPIIYSKNKKWDGMKKVLIINPWNAWNKKIATKSTTKNKIESNKTKGLEPPGEKIASPEVDTAATVAGEGTPVPGPDLAPGAGETPASAPPGENKT